MADCFWSHDSMVGVTEDCAEGSGDFDIPAFSTMRATATALANFDYGGCYIVGGYPVHADSIDDATAIELIGYFADATGISGEEGFWDGATPQPLMKDYEPYAPTHDDLTTLDEPVSLVLAYHEGLEANVWELGADVSPPWFNRQAVFRVTKPSGVEYHVGYTEDYGVG